MDQIEEAVNFFCNEGAPALKTQLGFANTRRLVDHATDKGLMVTIWQGEAELMTSESSGFLKTQLTGLSQFFASAPLVDRYTIYVNA